MSINEFEPKSCFIYK